MFGMRILKTSENSMTPTRHVCHVVNINSILTTITPISYGTTRGDNQIDLWIVYNDISDSSDRDGGDHEGEKVESVISITT